jgi:hypothetical protein
MAGMIGEAISEAISLKSGINDVVHFRQKGLLD